ncbi:hypothetical protein ALP66_200083 [Pseudomonas amygdali pv. photiniae]|uniref:TraW protein n=1 Tax=Pseudomonas amygdali pv. photiniae TaxID=251724 RepID=A0A0P9S6W1_PSEA0|nr:hypothetical protein [Pseudomonas amygdali]KPC57973.1 Uncharacterized protein AC509_1701 [Pseudomonas amygdali pv. morsprunorum]KPX54402.1 hypothetical protein ALO53_200034 [Pseudomonas amygdali pv. photiniae]RMS48289.1 hypothetical protein ALP66_200083 [Pseudomonas amygdali pv. photiniae]
MLNEFETEDGKAKWRSTDIRVMLDAEVHYRVAKEAFERNITKRKVIQEVLLKNYGLDYCPEVGGE